MSDVKQMFDQAGLIDAWVNVAEPSFTWTTNRTGQQAFSTLDRILYSMDVLKFSEQIADWSISISDHAAVVAGFDYKDRNRKKCILFCILLFSNVRPL